MKDPDVEAVRAFFRKIGPEAAAEVYRLMRESDSEKVRLAAALGILKGAGALKETEDGGATISLPPASLASLPTGKLLEMKRQQQPTPAMTPTPVTPSATPSGGKES